MHLRVVFRYLSGMKLDYCFASGICFALVSLSFNPVQAQTAPVVPENTSPTYKPQENVAPTWVLLDKNQQSALAPLEKSWADLSEGQRRKWLAVAKNYAGLGAPEQKKLHSRMVEWAALSPKEREVARLNFAHSKVLNESDREANWQAYQALSPTERKKLAEGAKVKPVGAAVSVRPVGTEKLTPVPVTRHTPEEERAELLAKRPLNRKTLLPQPLPLVSEAAVPADTSANKP